MYEICAKHIFGRNIYVHSKFYCEHLSHDLCVHAHVHSLEGTLVKTLVREFVTMCRLCLSLSALPMKSELQELS